MYYYVYVLLSEKDNQFYTGYTSNINERKRYHDEGKVESTKNRRPLKLVYWKGCLRHSFATHLLDKGTDIKYIKDVLGHFNIKTTERYLHVSKKQLVNIVSPFDDLYKNEEIDW